jgi:hypothetical protein
MCATIPQLHYIAIMMLQLRLSEAQAFSLAGIPLEWEEGPRCLHYLEALALIDALETRKRRLGYPQYHLAA